MHAIRAVLVVALATLLCACVTTKRPIGVSQGGQNDTRLLGGWRATDPKTGNTMFLFFLPRPNAPQKMEAVGVTPAHGDENGSWGSYAIVTGKTGEFTFINATPLIDDGRPKTADDYVPILYRIERSTLRYAMPDPDAIKAAVQSGQLAGEVKGSSIVITAEPAALDAYMAAHATTLFKPSEIVFKRLD